MDHRAVVKMFCLLVAVGTAAQIAARSKEKPSTSGSTEKAVEKLVDEYAEAAKNGDATFLEKNLARDYIGIEADGHMSTKPDVLELFRSGRVKFERFDVKDRKARIYVNVAVVISELAMTGHSGQAELNGTYRCTRVLERAKHGHWQSVSSQLTKLQ
jgi:hypothetical protein